MCDDLFLRASIYVRLLSLIYFHPVHCGFGVTYDFHITDMCLDYHVCANCVCVSQGLSGYVEHWSRKRRQKQQAEYIAKQMGISKSNATLPSDTKVTMSTASERIYFSLLKNQSWGFIRSSRLVHFDYSEYEPSGESSTHVLLLLISIFILFSRNCYSGCLTTWTIVF